LAFLRPDRLGKRKIASVLAGTIFGNAENLIFVDLGLQDTYYPLYSVFECQKSHVVMTGLGGTQLWTISLEN